MTNQRCQIFIPKSIIFSSSSLTLFFLLFTSLFPPFSQFQKMGGTWEEHGRNVFVSPSLLLCFPIVSKPNLASSFSLHSLIFRIVLVSPSLCLRFISEDKAKVKRSSIEDLSNIYRRPIEHLSKTYRRRGEEGAEREQRGSGEGAEEEFGYKVTKFRSLIFTFLVVSVT